MLACSLLVACLLAATACGGSSTKSSSTTNTTPTVATATTATTHTTATTATTATTTATVNKAQAASYRAKLSAYAACMRRNGVQIPPPTTTPNGVPALKAPHYAFRQQFNQALRNCRTYVFAVLQAQSKLVPAR